MSEGSFDMSAFPSLLSSNMNVLIRIQTPSMWLYFGTGSTCVVDSSKHYKIFSNPEHITRGTMRKS